MESFYSRFIDFFKIQPTSKLPLSHPERLKRALATIWKL